MEPHAPSCPRCGSERLATTPMGPGSPHHARTDCLDCGRFVRWEAAPMDAQRAADFVLPFGKHRGRTLEQIAADEEGRRYLHWLGAQDGIKGSVRRAIECHLAHPSVAKFLDFEP